MCMRAQVDGHFFCWGLVSSHPHYFLKTKTQLISSSLDTKPVSNLYSK
jgi:ABC-type uncharacterized transport system substrate-binding protein